MANNTLELKKITYHDIFALALAITYLEEFSSEITDWHRAIREICDKYRKTIPEVDIAFFDSRPPLPPMAEEVLALHSVLFMSGEMNGLGLGKDHVFIIPKEMRANIINGEIERLSKYLRQIHDMSTIFERHLKVKKE